MSFFDNLLNAFSDALLEGASMGMEEKKNNYDSMSDYELERMVANDDDDKVAAYLILMERNEEYYNENLYLQVKGNHFIEDKYKELIEKRIMEIEEESAETEDADEFYRLCQEYIERYQHNQTNPLSAIAVLRILFEGGFSYSDLKEEELIIECEIRYLYELFCEMREAEKEQSM